MTKLTKYVLILLMGLGKAVAVVVSGLLATQAIAAPGDFLFKLTAPDLQPGANFGDTVSIINGDILVGEPSRVVDDLPFVGQAYLFDGRTGALRLTLQEPEPRNRSRFGRSLAAGETSIFVGSAGRVYGFDPTTGNLRLQIDAPTDGDSSFGSNIAYGDRQLLVSEPSFSTGGLEGIAVGRAHLFDATTGQLELTLPNPEPSRQEAFGIGYSLAIFGDKLAVGSFPDNDFAGRVWVFDQSSGETLFTLENPNPAAQTSDWFGWSVAANDQLIVVSADEDSTDGVDGSGTVYAFDAVTGALRHTLFSPRAEIDGEFGRQIALTPHGDILVGAWGESIEGIKNAGRVYLFDGETGSLLLDISNPNPEFGVFGWSVTATDGAIIVGSPVEEAVYVFEAIPEPNAFVLTCTMILTVLGVKMVRRRFRAPAGVGKEV